MSAVTPIIAGNWKMHGLEASLMEIEALATSLNKARPDTAEVLICPAFTLISRMVGPAKAGGIALGGQDCHAATQGAHTGDISAEMLADAGASYVIVGHSERRADHGEGDTLVRAKAEAAHGAGLQAIVCVGETEAERNAGKALEIVTRQIVKSVPSGANAKNTVIAYEPVWAIGTGLVPTTDNVAEIHAQIRELLEEMFEADGKDCRILYGGSVKPANAKELLAVPNVNGALVGGASLKAEDFYGIISGYF